ncbi:MAG: lipocalin family protein [Bacteroidales bacterium]|nr:lipocalin family protein [Bacteroidales bacterium]
MKKTKFLALICLMMAMFCTLATSCKDDDDEGSSSLEGTWRSVSSTYTDENGKTHESDLTGDSDYMLFIITSTTITEKYYYNGKLEDDYTYTYSIKGNKIIDDEGDDGAYKISGNTLTITYTDDEDGTTTVLVLKRQ